MDDKAREVLKMGLLDSRSHREELFQYMGMIQRFDAAISSNSHIDRLSQELVRIVLEETQFEKSSIFIWDTEQNSLRLSAAMNLDQLLKPAQSGRVSAAEEWDAFYHIVNEVYFSRTPVFLEKFVGSEQGDPSRPVIKPISLASMPIADLGVLNLSTREPVGFPFHVRRTWEILCKIIGYLLKVSPVEPRLLKAESTAASMPGQTVSVQRPKSGRPLKEGLDEFMGAALDFTPQGICLLDSAGQLVGVNRTMRELQGESVTEMIGRSPALFFLDPENFHRLLEKAFPDGRAELTDVFLVNQRGESYQADVYLIGLPMEKEQTHGYLMVINDVTKRNALTERILQAEKLVALGTMAGGVAHDFNNLLMAILGHIQLLVPQVEDTDIVRRLRNIEKAVFDGSHIIRRLQKFTERERDAGLTLVPVDVGEAVRDVVELTRPRWKNAMEKLGRTIKFETDLQPGCIAPIHGSDLREVLTNLVFNAIEAMPQGGVIKLSCRAHQGNILLEVTDSGIGMSREVVSKIFDPFFTTKGVGNSGLGLSVCWSLIVRHGGDIQVKSLPGKGTTFFITLPRIEPQKGGKRSSQEVGAAESRKILVVDDDEEILSILRDMIQLKGHRVHVASEGSAALELIQKEDFDLVLTDLGMPVISGWEIARCVKEKDRRTPVVLVTGWGTQYEEEDLSARGVDLVLSKPLSWDKLLEAVTRLLSAPK